MRQTTSLMSQRRKRVLKNHINEGACRMEKQEEGVHYYAAKIAPKESSIPMLR